MTNTEHTRSYYAATANDTTRYPPLAGDVAVDVCIIGGGFSGISTAIELADRGASVMVLEANRIGWGASGRNGGQVQGGIPGEGRLAAGLGPEGKQLVSDIYYRGHEIILDRIKRFNIACDLKYGYLESALTPSQLAAIHAHVEGFDKRGGADHLRLIDRVEMAQLLGTERYIGGYFDSRNLHLHPLNLIMGEARGAASIGVRIHEETAVTSIQHGDQPKVVTPRGTVTCKTVVLAGNAYHRLEQPALGGYLFPAGTYIIATEPLSEARAKRINALDAAVSDSRMVLDYFRLSADRRLLFGGLCQYANRDPASITRTLRASMLAVWPDLADVKIDYEWGGQIGIVISRVPLIGRTKKNVFYLQGYSGHGVNTTHIAAEIVANAISGDTRVLDQFGRIRQWRMPTHPWIGSQMLALGMSYYRLKDLV
jgi:gamma-glutamylputrescine oxidase